MDFMRFHSSSSHLDILLFSSPLSLQASLSPLFPCLVGAQVVSSRAGDAQVPTRRGRPPALLRPPAPPPRRQSTRPDTEDPGELRAGWAGAAPFLRPPCTRHHRHLQTHGSDLKARATPQGRVCSAGPCWPHGSLPQGPSWAAS